VKIQKSKVKNSSGREEETSMVEVSKLKEKKGVMLVSYANWSKGGFLCNTPF